MIEIYGLGKRFGEHTAVEALDLTVPPGEIYALLGPNGAGKRTTIACVLGFLKPDSGSVRLCGSTLAPQQQPLGTPRTSRRTSFCTSV